MTKCKKPVSLLSVLGSGGHTTEMLKLVESLDQDNYQKTFLHANTDSISAKKLMLLSSQDFQVIFDSPLIEVEKIAWILNKLYFAGLSNSKGSSSWSGLDLGIPVHCYRYSQMFSYCLSVQTRCGIGKWTWHMCSCGNCRKNSFLCETLPKA